MRHSDLRRFLIGLAASAVPVPLALAGCGGSVHTDGSDDESSGGAMIYTGTGGYKSTGGVPPYVGQAPTGGRPVYVGAGGGPQYTGLGGFQGTGGYPNYPGTGGLLIVTGGAGGAPPYVGMGGAILTGGTGPEWVDAGEAVDAGRPTDAPDANPPFNGLGGTAGRRPPGLQNDVALSCAGSPLRLYFEEMARLEAASVPAFRRLGHELRTFGAPRALLDAARRAARDEVRHARASRILAERFGGRYTPPRIAKRPPRSLEELALDNATEGGVRETFGAMIATWQARAASDPVVRAKMRPIAVDETRHAALAIQVARWAERRLSKAAAERVREARRRTALAVLQELAESNPSPELVSIAGLPSRDDSLRLASAMRNRLWV